jgi:hypothetical protein
MKKLCRIWHPEDFIIRKMTKMEYDSEMVKSMVFFLFIFLYIPYEIFKKI